MEAQEKRTHGKESRAVKGKAGVKKAGGGGTLRNERTRLKFLDRHYKHYGSQGINPLRYRPKEIEELLDMAQLQLEKEKSFLEVDPPIMIVGDIHGQYNDLLLMLATLGRPPHSRYLFLGDYVDRGRQSLETIVLLLAYKVSYPDHVFLLRGNHECRRINEVYGFKAECQRRFKSSQMWRRFSDVFNWLPCAGLVGEKILCMHGGLSPQLTSLEQLKALPRPTEADDDVGLIIDLLWSDPEVGMKGWERSPRKISYIFGQDVVELYCKNLNIELIVRGHQCCKSGYRYFANRKLVTIFSAPNYCGDTDNSGAIMEVSPRFLCKFRIFKPCKTFFDKKTTSSSGKSSTSL